MDKRKRLILQARAIGGFFFILTAVCFSLILPFVHKPLAGLSIQQTMLSAGFWLGVFGLYTTFAYFYFQFKPYNLYKGNKAMLGPVLAFLILAAIFYYYHAILISHLGWYAATALLAGWGTLGVAVFFLVVISLVRMRLAARHQKF